MGLDIPDFTPEIEAMLEGVELPPRGFDPLRTQNIKHLHTKEELLQALAALEAEESDDPETEEDNEEQPAPTKPSTKSKRIETEEEKNKRLAPRRAREQAKREQAQREQEKDLAAASAPKSKKKATKLGKAQQELGAQQRQAKAKASGGAPNDAQESFLLEPSKVSSSTPTSFSRRKRAPRFLALNSGTKDRAPNNSLPRVLPKALPGAGCQSDYRQRLPAILVAPVLSHTYGLQELALPDTPRLALPAAEPAPAVPRLPAVLAQTALPALGPLQVACSSTIKGYPDSAYVQVKHVREPIFHGKGGRLDGCDGGGGKGGRRGK
jgi:hypothetical protein